MVVLGDLVEQFGHKKPGPPQGTVVSVPMCQLGTRHGHMTWPRDRRGPRTLPVRGADQSLGPAWVGWLDVAVGRRSACRGGQVASLSVSGAATAAGADTEGETTGG